MKTTKSGYLSSYWPVALAVALIALAALRAYGDGGATREPLPADRVTAELARTVGYRFIDAAPTPTASSVRSSGVPAPMPRAS